MSAFEDQYKLLNPSQREAVNTTQGPLLVIAGPGTGKTQLLSMRVANIMRTSDADASNILCLTFTNKAALNMRDRLLRLVGSEANKVTVKTFHGFAAEIMNNYPDYFWNGARLSTAPDAVQLEIVQTILAKLPLSNPLSLRFAGQFTSTDDTIKALRFAKEAGLTPDKLRAILEANLAYIEAIEPDMVSILSATLSAKKLPELQAAVEDLPEQGIDESISPLLSLTTVVKESLAFAISQDEGTGKTKNTGKWKSRWVQTQSGQKGMFDERKRNEWWLAFSRVYADYRTELHAKGYYDYSDMLLEVIVQLEQNADLIASVQERFQYVLIDEFQDSNSAQLRLAHLVANHHTAEGRPNIMAVGDDDQSIFGFNGAELNNMLYFGRNYDEVKRIVLEDNYRSSQAILDASEKIIVQAEDRLVNRIEGLSKSLTARNEPSKTGVIEHLSYPTREHQLSEIARHIKAARKDQTLSIAVLARGHDSLQQLSSLLLNLEVPVQYERQSNILDNEVIRQVLLLCETVNAIAEGNRPAANEKIAKIVRHPMWGLKPHDLWMLATSNFKNPDWLESLRGSEVTEMKQLGEWLHWLSGEAVIQPLPITLEYVLGLRAGVHLTSPIRDYYMTSDEISAEYLHGLSALRLLRGLVNEFAGSENGTLNDFLHFIRLNAENGRGITDESPFVSGENAVELYTVHKSKGLEFDHVYIIDAVEDNWKPRVAGRKPPANLPLQPPGEKNNDYVRLLYVAATRAKRSLTIGSFRNSGSGGDVLPSPIVRQAIPEQIIDAGKATTIQVLEENLRWPRLTPADEQAMLQTKLQNYQLSATHLLDFLDIVHGGPTYFLERHILSLPEAGSSALAYGNAMHAALQLAQKQINQDAFDIEKITDWYGRSLKSAHLPVDEYEKFLPHGQEKLRTMFASGFSLIKGGLAEQHINDINIGRATIKGVIDRIDQTPESLMISDYKTGGPLSSFTTKDHNKAPKAWRHRSQLIFYALLIRNSSRFHAAPSLNSQMIYLEAEDMRDMFREYQPTNEDIERMQKLCNAVWDKILALEFPDVSGYTEDIAGITKFEEDLLKS